jgi:hypothetical protein
LLGVLEQHKRWLDSGVEEGQRANLQHANLQGADFQGAALRFVDLQHAGLQHADLRFADLRGADLQGADLYGADLRHADLDFSCLPLWCGGLNIKADRRLVAQIAFHLAALDVSECEDAETIEAMATFRATPMATWFKQYRSDV